MNKLFNYDNISDKLVGKTYTEAKKVSDLKAKQYYIIKI